MSDHTTTPWTVHYDDSGFYFIDGENRPSPFVVATGGESNADKANAELIVTAVNAHADLTESVTNLLSLVKAHTGPDDAIATAAIEQAGAALKLARGEP